MDTPDKESMGEIMGPIGSKVKQLIAFSQPRRSGRYVRWGKMVMDRGSRVVLSLPSSRAGPSARGRAGGRPRGQPRDSAKGEGKAMAKVEGS